jgi:ABC-type multidrug transport system fused ATPase/permease subunit
MRHDIAMILKEAMNLSTDWSIIMNRRLLAVFSVIIGLVLGVIGNAFFWNPAPGLSFPLFIALATAAMLGLKLASGARPTPRNLWPLIPMLFFAVMVALRSDWMILVLDVGAALMLGALALFYLPLRRPLDEEPFVNHVGAALASSLAVFPYSLVEAGGAWSWLREKGEQRRLTSVARGLVFAVPVLLVFTALLGSADVVFAKTVTRAWDGFATLFGLKASADMAARLVFTVGIAAVATGAFGFGLRRGEAPAEENASPEGAKEKSKPFFKLSMIESSIVLGSVVLLFALFVIIQFAYFFGGRANISVEGLTYAEYARRGFFELVAVAALTLGLALGLDQSTVRQEGRETTIFRLLCIALVALTTVILTSASQRMWLYEESYGFTQLRVYTHVFMFWLGALFAFFLLAVFRVRRNIFSLGTLLVLIGYLGTLNLMNVDFYIAQHNIDRYRAGQRLDIAFLNTLSADAVPAVLPLYNATEPGTKAHDWAGQWLVTQLATLEGWRASGNVSSFNASREAAWAQLDAIRAGLPAYDPTQYWGSPYDSFEEDMSRPSGWDAVTPEAGRQSSEGEG